MFWGETNEQPEKGFEKMSDATNEPVAKPFGRPTSYCEPTVREILERLCEGESLRSICRDERMPNMSTVLLWKSKHPDFSNQYETAMRARAQHLFDELLEIADDSSKDKILDENGNERTNAEVVARSRLKVDTRKWALSKMIPKLYGDKVEQVHSGEVTINKIERTIIDGNA